MDPLLVHGIVGPTQRPLVDLEGALDGVIPVDEDFGLDDGHEAGLLGEGRVQGERPGVRLYALDRRYAVADGDDRPPLGEARAHAHVLLEPLAQAVQALGVLLTGGKWQVPGAPVHLDPGDNALL